MQEVKLYIMKKLRITYLAILIVISIVVVYFVYSLLYNTLENISKAGSLLIIFGYVFIISILKNINL